MMPVVDAGVGLSQSGYSLNDYLLGIKQFHVLRMVAVQHQQSTATALQELNYFQSQASTRGFGGFPNALVASVDLFNPAAIKELAEVEVLENLRSVCHCFAACCDDCDQSDWEQSLNILVQKELCLDLFAAEASDTIVIQMAAFQPELSIILNITSAAKNQVHNTVQRLTQLAKYNNIYLKICGDESLTSDAHQALASLIDNALELFGFERTMFASGINHHFSEDTFDQLWSQSSLESVLAASCCKGIDVA